MLILTTTGALVDHHLRGTRFMPTQDEKVKRDL